MPSRHVQIAGNYFAHLHPRVVGGDDAAAETRASRSPVSPVRAGKEGPANIRPQRPRITETVIEKAVSRNGRSEITIGSGQAP